MSGIYNAGEYILLWIAVLFGGSNLQLHEDNTTVYVASDATISSSATSRNSWTSSNTFAISEEGSWSAIFVSESAYEMASFLEGVMPDTGIAFLQHLLRYELERVKDAQDDGVFNGSTGLLPFAGSQPAQAHMVALGAACTFRWIESFCTPGAPSPLVEAAWIQFGVQLRDVEFDASLSHYGRKHGGLFFCKETPYNDPSNPKREEVAYLRAFVLALFAHEAAGHGLDCADDGASNGSPAYDLWEEARRSNTGWPSDFAKNYKGNEAVGGPAAEFWAEGVALYTVNPQMLQTINPALYERVKEVVAQHKRQLARA